MDRLVICPNDHRVYNHSKELLEVCSPVTLMTIASLVLYLAYLPQPKHNLLTDCSVIQDARTSCTDKNTYYSPDEKWKVYCRNGNIWLSDRLGTYALRLTHDGGKQSRIQYGTIPWVYQNGFGFSSTVWWSPDSKKVAYYRFDERGVLDYFMQLNNLGSESTLDVEPYPLPGYANPLVDICIYDLASHKTIRADVREASDNEEIGYYVYAANIQTTTSTLRRTMWSQDSKTLLFYRTNRRQNIMEFVACNPETGKCRALLRETSLCSWVENSPAVFFLPGWQKFILMSERSGWWNLYLYNVSGKPIKQLTDHPFDVVEIDNVEGGKVTYKALGGDNPYENLIYQVNLDGTADHLVKASAPASNAELFTYYAADKHTTLYGCLEKPPNFDPNKKYPLLVIVYLQPGSSTVSKLYMGASPYVNSGFLVAAFDSRGSGNRGKDFKDLIYGKFGTIEIDDQAEGVRYLCQRPYVDNQRVGVVGSSQGGYDAIMCLLRYPDVFQVACASSSVTDWRNYYSIYTERYMGLPEENKTGYDEASAIFYACDLKGRLMLFYGTADTNVHPCNTLQLINALQKAHKTFSVQVGPDRGHEELDFNIERMFFVENLIAHPPTP